VTDLWRSWPGVSIFMRKQNGIATMGPGAERGSSSESSDQGDQGSQDQSEGTGGYSQSGQGSSSGGTDITSDSGTVYDSGDDD
jgi:hypothetical protein